MGVVLGMISLISGHAMLHPAETHVGTLLGNYQRLE